MKILIAKKIKIAMDKLWKCKILQIIIWNYKSYTKIIYKAKYDLTKFL